VRLFVGTLLGVPTVVALPLPFGLWMLAHPLVFVLVVFRMCEGDVLGVFHALASPVGHMDHGTKSCLAT